MGGSEITNSSFNFVPDPVSEQCSLFNVDMVVEEDNDFVCDKRNTNAARSTKSVNPLNRMATENGSRNVNIFLSSLESKSLPNHEPRVIQTELKEKIIHLDDIDNVTFTRAGNIIISIKVVECAIDGCL